MNENIKKLVGLGQRLWIDDITRDMLDNGTLERYISEFSITGLTSNPTIFEHAIAKGSAYDKQMGELTRAGSSGEELYTQLMLSDLRRAADLFWTTHEATS